MNYFFMLTVLMLLYNRWGEPTPRVSWALCTRAGTCRDSFPARCEEHGPSSGTTCFSTLWLRPLSRDKCEYHALKSALRSGVRREGSLCFWRDCSGSNTSLRFTTARCSCQGQRGGSIPLDLHHKPHPFSSHSCCV